MMTSLGVTRPMVLRNGGGIADIQVLVGAGDRLHVLRSDLSNAWPNLSSRA